MIILPVMTMYCEIFCKITKERDLWNPKQKKKKKKKGSQRGLF